MPDRTEPGAPWLIAAWPGMGSVAVIATGYLVEHLGLKPGGELPSGGHFDVERIIIKDGLIDAPPTPRGLFFRPDPDKAAGTGPLQREVFVFLGEAQPSSGAFAYAHELLEAAVGMGVERVVTFASMAAKIHPASPSKVTGIATDRAVLDELRRAEVEPMDEGQIGGLNGVLIAAAAERGMPGIGLLAEIPFFAPNVPNPKAARAALSVFCILAGLDVSLDGLNEQVSETERALTESLEKLQGQGMLPPDYGKQPDTPEAAPDESPDGEPPAPARARPELDEAARDRVERMFEEARKDQNVAMILKEELDRLGVFDQYENRFLDLFERGD